MNYLNYIILITIKLYTISLFDFNENIVHGAKIGYISGSSYKFSIDTTKFKKQWQQILPVKGIQLDKIEILKANTLGDKKEDYYVMASYNKTHSLKSVRWLIREGDSLYFFKNTNNNVDNEVFYRTYYTVYGSDNNCFPQAHYIDNQYLWAAGEKLVCHPDDPCKSGSVFFPVE